MSRITGNDAKGLMEAYSAVYTPQELTEEQVWEEVETWVNSLLEEGYDLSDYTWEEMYESYLEEAPMTAFQAAGGNAKLAQLNKGRSPRSGRVTPAQLERQGQQNLYKAGGGDAAIAQGPTRNQNVRGGRTIKVPTLTRQEVINRGAVAAAKPPTATPPPKPPTVTPPPKPPTGTPPPKPPTATPPPKPPTGSPGGDTKLNPTPPATATPTTAPAAKPAARPSGGAPRPAATAPASLKVTPTKPTATATPTPSTSPARPSLSSQADEIRKMRAGSLARQGKTLEASTVSGTTKPAYQANSFDPFDVVKGHLIDEGYADTEEAALKIMANMSESWKNSIIG
jgi:hypothetical protein